MKKCFLLTLQPTYEAFLNSDVAILKQRKDKNLKAGFVILLVTQIQYKKNITMGSPSHYERFYQQLLCREYVCCDSS